MPKAATSPATPRTNASPYARPPIPASEEVSIIDLGQCAIDPGHIEPEDTTVGPTPPSDAEDEGGDELSINAESENLEEEEEMHSSEQSEQYEGNEEDEVLSVGDDFNQPATPDSVVEGWIQEAKDDRKRVKREEREEARKEEGSDYDSEEHRSDTSDEEDFARGPDDYSDEYEN